MFRYASVKSKEVLVGGPYFPKILRLFNRPDRPHQRKHLFHHQFTMLQKHWWGLSFHWKYQTSIRSSLRNCLQKMIDQDNVLVMEDLPKYG